MKTVKFELKIQLKSPESLIPYERNVKKHDERQVDGIVAAIRQAKGFDQPIVVDRNLVIIKGHGRRLAAMKLGMTQVPVIVRDDLSDEEVRAARLNDNRAGVGGTDTEMFREEMATINAELLTGVFDAKELDFAIADLGSINTDPLIDDLDAAVSAQEEEAKNRADAVADKRIPLVKAFGFKDISGADELAVTRFMAKAEAETGQAAAAALVAYIKTLL